MVGRRSSRSRMGTTLGPEVSPGTAVDSELQRALLPTKSVFGSGEVGWLFVLLDALAVIAFTTFAIVIRRELLPAFPGIDEFLPVKDYVTLWPALLLLLLGRAAVGLYPGFGLHPAEELRRQTWVTVGLVAAVLGGGVLFSFAINYSRIVLVLTSLLLLVGLPTVRTGMQSLLAKTGRFGAPVWVVGNSTRATRLASLLVENPSLGLRPVGIGVDLPDLDLPCRRCLVVPDDLGDQPIADLLDQLNERFERVWLVPELLDVASVWVTPRDIQGHLALELRNNLLERGNQITKRFLDLGLAVASLPLSVPVACVAATAIALSGAGPIIFRQERIGVGGRRIQVLKFRTMHSDAEHKLAEHLRADPAAREEWQRSRKLLLDPRVTRVGRFLRRTSLDELPQLINVLRGEMSLVGPRPVMHDEVSWYGGKASLLLKVKPGMTGLTQVSGRSELSYEERVRIDTYYVRNWSVWLDLVILGKTVGAVLGRRGAY